MCGSWTGWFNTCDSMSGRRLPFQAFQTRTERADGSHVICIQKSMTEHFYGVKPLHVEVSTGIELWDVEKAIPRTQSLFPLSLRCSRGLPHVTRIQGSTSQGFVRHPCHHVPVKKACIHHAVCSYLCPTGPLARDHPLLPGER